jgi:two-component system response regulator YesN
VDELVLADLLKKLRADIIKDNEDMARLNNTGDNYLIKQVKSYIEQNYQDELSLTLVAGVVNVNSNYLSVMFKNQTGESFVDYFTRVRIEKAKQLLKDVRLKTYEVGELVGYRDAAYFSKVFKKSIGMSPGEYRNRVLQ